MNLFQTLIEMSELCEDGLISTIISIVKTVFTIIQFGVPAVLIILCAIDMFKAMTNGDDKEIAKIRKTAIRRLIYALVIFLIIPLISLILNFVSRIVDGTDDATNTWEQFLQCWDYNSSSNGGSSSKGQCYDDNGYESSLGKSACENAGYRWVS